MKKLLVVLIVLITGATLYFGKNSPNSTTIPQPSPVVSTTREAFEMKEECAKYTDAIDLKMKKTLWSRYNIDDIFYSPVKNSCLYAVTAIQDNRTTPYGAYIIWDYLSDKMLFYRDTSLTNNQDINAIYNNAKKYLMGTETMKYSHDDWGTDISE